MSAEYPLWDAWWSAGRPGAMTPAEFESAMNDWVAEEAHSGPEPSEKLVGYTRLNAVRMRRVAKTYRMSEPMQAFLDSGACRGQHWVVITESWCGDAVQVSPLINIWAERAGATLELALRDGAHAIIEDFLTRGGKAIPKWVVADDQGGMLAQWGPRPSTAHDMVAAHRALPEPKPDYAEFAAEVQLWYARDRGRELEKEALELLRASVH